jgi:parvulin-like peptidyl-prolyl isomerase
LLAREAQALGLDDNDVIIRRRLSQKLSFLLDDTLRRVEPSDDELRDYYAANAQRFRSGARISFTHIYFSPQRRADALSDATEALKLLDEEAALAPAELGDRLLAPLEFQDEAEQSVSNAFGPDFARAVFSLQPDRWRGPIASGYGVHLVRVLALREARLPPLSEVRERVAEEWKRERELAAREQFLEQLRKKHTVVIGDEVKALIEGAAAATARGP